MKHFSSPPAVAAGLAVVVLTNVFILSSAARNRGGTPLTEIVLTERELAPPQYREEDQTGLFLNLTLGDLPHPDVRRVAWLKNVILPPPNHSWLNRAKLLELGFAVKLDPTDPGASDYYSGTIPRQVYVVLEFEGEAWKRDVTERESKLQELRIQVEKGLAGREKLDLEETLFALDRVLRSRLIPVDAGRDAGRLRQRWANRQHVMIMQGVIALHLTNEKDHPPTLRTSLRLRVNEINVPANLRPKLEGFLPTATEEETMTRLRAKPVWPTPTPARYRTVVAVGQKNIPWLVTIDPT